MKPVRLAEEETAETEVGECDATRRLVHEHVAELQVAVNNITLQTKREALARQLVLFEISSIKALRASC